MSTTLKNIVVIQGYSLSIMFLLFCSCKNMRLKNEQIIIDRISFVLNLKTEVDKQVWNTFNNKLYDVPLIYYTDSTSYIANPTELFLKSCKSKLVFQNNQIRIYKTINRADQIPFHMETRMTLGDSTEEYDYHSPFMKCSSFEEVAKAIPEVLSTEEWASMVIHEYFHGFQYKHPTFINYYENHIVGIQADSLKTLYNNYIWYKNSIDKENHLILEAIKEKDSSKRNHLIIDFFKFRFERRMRVKKEIDFNLEPLEKAYETIEGTARYVEYNLYTIFANIKDNMILKSDSSFYSFQKFKHFNIENEKWLFRTEKTSYYYAIGFNMARLLDAMNIEYKSILFKNGGLTLEDLLFEEIYK